MKIVITTVFAAIALVAQALWAFPSVGDTIEYKLTVVELASGNTMSFTLTSVVVEKKGNTVKIKHITRVPGLPEQVEVFELDADQFPTAEEMGEQINQCTSLGGTPETITVKAGTFKTCRFDTVDSTLNERETAWFGNVPLGVVKLVREDGSRRYEQELTLVDLARATR